MRVPTKLRIEPSCQRTMTNAKPNRRAFAMLIKSQSDLTKTFRKFIRIIRINTDKDVPPDLTG